MLNKRETLKSGLQKKSRSEHAPAFKTVRPRVLGALGLAAAAGDNRG
jgi:hypothetical protein